MSVLCRYSARLMGDRAKSEPRRAPSGFVFCDAVVDAPDSTGLTMLTSS